jgi:hypothetical protein
MPKRTKPHIGPGKTLVNGGRAIETENGRVIVLKEVEIDLASIHKKVAAYIEKFDELGQLGDRVRFVQDLAHECAWAQSLRFDYLVSGTKTKPGEWTTQIVVRGLATIMQRHGLKPTISEYLDKNRNKQQSLYLRLIPGLIRIAGFRAPMYVKGLALRAKRISHESTVTKAEAVGRF